MLQQATLEFLKELKENNNKPWFDEHREQYLAAKADFEGLVQKVIVQFGKKEEGIAGLLPKNCVFRQYRDVRFSKDKTPYKVNMGASFTEGGKKSPLAGYYLHCEPGNSFVGGGLWMPEADALKKVRQEIDYCFDEFKKMLAKKAFAEQYGHLDMKEHTLSREPKGYDKDNHAIDYLKLKSFVAMRPLTDADLTAKDAAGKIVTAFTALQPVVHFINRSLRE